MRRFFVFPDPILLMSLIGILIMSMFVLYSATHKVHQIGLTDSYWMRQMVWLGIGFLFMLAVTYMDYRHIGTMAWLWYLFGLILLVAVLVFGRNISGSQRWLHFAGVTIQPSEFMKPLVVMIVAWFFDFFRHDRLHIGHVCVSGVLVLIPLILIAKEPDLGTALVLIPMFLAVLFVAGLPWGYFVGFAGLGLVFAPLAWMFILKGYQKKRILTFMNPYDDQFGAGWPVIQSKIAIGSGQLHGKGFMKGTQTQLDFLSEHHTDFIFSVLGEEWGFVGVLLLFSLFAIFFIRSLYIAEKTYDPLGRLMIVGIVTIMAFQFLVNVGMTFGFCPVTGLPLPFMSYGGSALVSYLFCVGLILSVSRRREL